MTQNEALEALRKYIKNGNLIKHSIAVGGIMRELAVHFKEDEKKWLLCGILHDIDYEKTKDDFQKHSLLGAEMLKELGVGKDVCQAVKAHNFIHNIGLETLMEKALFVADSLSGLIVAAVLISPSKKIADIDSDFILSRFSESSFARGANREVIKKCQDLLNLTLEEFVRIGLEGMKKESEKLSL